MELNQLPKVPKTFALPNELISRSNLSYYYLLYCGVAGIRTLVFHTFYIKSLYSLFLFLMFKGTLVILKSKNESYAAIKTASLCKEIILVSLETTISLISTVLFSMLPFIKFTFVFKVLPHYWDYVYTYIKSIAISTPYLILKWTSILLCLQNYIKIFNLASTRLNILHIFMNYHLSLAPQVLYSFQTCSL